MAGRIYNFVARALRAKQDQTSGENNLVDDENTYDISLAVILAGYAFESYYDPVSGDSKIMIIIWSLRWLFNCLILWHAAVYEAPQLVEGRAISLSTDVNIYFSIYILSFNKNILN